MKLQVCDPCSDLITSCDTGFLSTISDRDFDRCYEDYCCNTSFSPSIEVRENKDAFELIAELPGFSKEDVNIELKENVLTLSGEKKEVKSDSEQEGYYYSERCYGKFCRSFSLPVGTVQDEIKAVHKDGVLKIEIPKPAELKAEVKRIEIK